MTDKNESDYKKNFPHHADLLLNDEDVRLRLTQVLSLSEMFLSLLTVEKKGDSMHAYFARSATHRALFHTLSREFARTMLAGNEHKPWKANISPFSIGVPIPILYVKMQLAENKTQRICQNIVREGVEKKFLHEAINRFDNREKLIYVSPSAFTKYLIKETAMIDEIVERSGIAEAEQKIAEKNKSNPAWKIEIEEKLKIALDLDDAK
tara:strand:+ start:209 stop:832 length:624 start_codon:yes stop_codon:yes gene_type:complete